jgi:hypothetical protein
LSPSDPTVLTAAKNAEREAASSSGKLCHSGQHGGLVTVRANPFCGVCHTGDHGRRQTGHTQYGVQKVFAIAVASYSARSREEGSLDGIRGHVERALRSGPALYLHRIRGLRTCSTSTIEAAS